MSTLRLLAKTLDVSLDELMAEGEHAPRKRGPVPQVQRRDREDMADVAGYVRGIRADRFSDTPGKD